MTNILVEVSEEMAKELADWAEQGYLNIIGGCCGTSPEYIKAIVDAVQTVLDSTDGRLYGIFNNASYGQAGAVEDLSRDILRQQFETNLFGTHELTRQIIPIMRRQGEGRIIQNSSLLGMVILPYRGAYNASKFALEGLTDTLRL